MLLHSDSEQFHISRKHNQRRSTIVCSLLQLLCFSSVHVKHLLQRRLTDAILRNPKIGFLFFNACEKATNFHFFGAHPLAGFGILSLAEDGVGIPFIDEVVQISHTQLARSKHSKTIKVNANS